MDKIILILAARFNVDPEIIEKVIRSEFDFVSTTIEQGNFESVHLHHLGKFCVKPGRLYHIKRLENEFGNKHN